MTNLMKRFFLLSLLMITLFIFTNNCGSNRGLNWSKKNWTKIALSDSIYLEDRWFQRVDYYRNGIFVLGGYWHTDFPEVRLIPYSNDTMCVSNSILFALLAPNQMFDMKGDTCWVPHILHHNLNPVFVVCEIYRNKFLVTHKMMDPSSNESNSNLININYFLMDSVGSIYGFKSITNCAPCEFGYE